MFYDSSVGRDPRLKTTGLADVQRSGLLLVSTVAATGSRKKKPLIYSYPIKSHINNELASKQLPINAKKPFEPNFQEDCL